MELNQAINVKQLELKLNVKDVCIGAGLFVEFH